MAGFQRTTVMGNLGRDPVMRETKDGKSVCNFSVAVNDGFGDNEHTEWFNVTVWDKTAEACGQYLTKGSQVLVDGKLKTREYEKDGETKRATDLNAFTVQFMGKREEGAGAGGSQKQLADDEIPF